MLTAEDMSAAADSIAFRLLRIPEGRKDSELRKRKTANEVLYCLVRDRLNFIRNQAG